MTDTPSPSPTATAGSSLLQGFLSRGILPVLLVVMFLGFGITQPNVYSLANLENILIQSSYITVFAAAQMMVILTRGFDLSLGVTVSLVSVLSGMVMVAWLGGHPGSLVIAVLLGCLAGIVAGCLVGVVNGLCVSLLKVNPFVVTLGTLNIVLALASTISGGFPIFDIPNEFNVWFYKARWFGLPPPVVAAGIMLALTYVILNRTVLGRSFYLLGGNPRAALVAGLPSRTYLTLAYVICSFYAAVGALMLTARTGSGEPNLGGNLTLESIAAAVIGGVSLRGGEGTVWSPLQGALFVTVLSNGMNLQRVDGYIQQIILGVVIIGAIFLDTIRRRRA